MKGKWVVIFHDEQVSKLFDDRSAAIDEAGRLGLLTIRKNHKVFKDGVYVERVKL